MSLTAGQINSFNMVATCCLANLGSKLADMERICDPSYKCLEEKTEYIRMFLSEICGYVPDGVEILPQLNLTSTDWIGNSNPGDTMQFFADGVAISNPVVLGGNFFSVVTNIAASLLSVSGFIMTSDYSTYILLTAPTGTGTQYGGQEITAVVVGTGTLVVFPQTLSHGIAATENNCISSDDAEAIINKIQSEFNICSSLAELPETTLLTSPCGCN